jgi:hypothetical protein
MKHTAGVVDVGFYSLASIFRNVSTQLEVLASCLCCNASSVFLHAESIFNIITFTCTFTFVFILDATTASLADDVLLKSRHGHTCVILLGLRNKLYFPTLFHKIQ